MSSPEKKPCNAREALHLEGVTTEFSSPRERARSSTGEISLKISQKKLRAPTSATSSPHLIGIASS
ncbi:hypothetical protein TIFTF001_016908 [Ficus carica]|uniref:Uncharacterized protein n=1 Tax=Ficus carica TaxID=3494 RepID=A0AA88A401_FICCA|nr:hypothetical protein TIFTF001_016908 [Ficus carica]